MNFIIQYEDGEGLVKATPHEAINGREITEVVFDLYTRLYVQDFQIESFRRKWHAIIAGGNEHAVCTETGAKREAFNVSITIHGQSQFNQWIVIDGNDLYFIYPERELWVKRTTQYRYSTRVTKANS